MSDNDEHLTEVLNQLKRGTDLIKVKSNGKRLSRRFYLSEREGFISYQRSAKPFRKPQICKCLINGFNNMRQVFI